MITEQSYFMYLNLCLSEMDYPGSACAQCNMCQTLLLLQLLGASVIVSTEENFKIFVLWFHRHSSLAKNWSFKYWSNWMRILVLKRNTTAAVGDICRCVYGSELQDICVVFCVFWLAKSKQSQLSKQRKRSGFINIFSCQKLVIRRSWLPRIQAINNFSSYISHLTVVIINDDR